MRRLALVMSLLLAGLSVESPMVAQTCAPPECVGPVEAPDALFAPALHEARGRSWRLSGRRGAAPRRGRARWASPPVATGPGTGLGVLALEGLPGSRRPGASAWVAFERVDGWHACEAAARPGSRSAVRVDAEAPVATRLFEQGPPGVTVALHFSEGWRERAFDYFVWHEHIVACVLGGDVPACFGSVETESGWSESDGEGSERIVERVRASFDGRGHVDVEAGGGRESAVEGDPSIFDQVGRHDVRSLGCALPPR